MSSLKKFQTMNIDNFSLIRYFLISLAFFSIISPFTGFLDLHSNLFLYLNKNFYSLTQYPVNINPLFLIFESIMFEINLLLENYFPKLWGSNNFFFLRFAIKLPLFLFFFLNALLTYYIIAN